MQDNNEGLQAKIRSDRFMREALNNFGTSVWRVALSQTGSFAEAEDVYQDVFILLAQSSIEFKHDEHMKAWLLRVAVNKCRDVARTRQTRAADTIENLPFEISADDQTFMDRDHMIWDAVRALPDSMRIVIYLFYVEGYSGDEIARLLDAKPSTIRSRLQRARERLRHILGGTEHGSFQCIQIDDGSPRSPEPS